MEIEKIMKVKFIKSDDYISTSLALSASAYVGEEIIEIDIDFNQLLDIISEIELKRNGFGKSIHKEAFTGVDYLGNLVKFSSYVIWQDNDQDNDIIYKYNFDENWIPFDNEILRRDREVKLNKILR
jgi:hypothetical protein